MLFNDDACAWLDRSVPARQSSPATVEEEGGIGEFSLGSQLEPGRLPVPAPSPTSSPVLGDPKKLVQDDSGSLKSFPSPKAVNTTTGLQLPNYVFVGSLDLPWKPGHLRSAYGAICCHKFKPKNQTDDIFLAQILGHNLLGPNVSLSVGQSYKDFYVK
jgi:Telomere resolvase